MCVRLCGCCKKGGVCLGGGGEGVYEGVQVCVVGWAEVFVGYTHINVRVWMRVCDLYTI